MDASACYCRLEMMTVWVETLTRLLRLNAFLSQIDWSGQNVFTFPSEDADKWLLEYLLPPDPKARNYGYIYMCACVCHTALSD